MRPDLKAMIERGARGLYDYDAIDSAGHTWESLPKATQSFLKGAAVACLRSALPGLFTEPPECWLAPWEASKEMADKGEFEASAYDCFTLNYMPTAWAAMRDAHLANPIPDAEQSGE